MRYIFTLLFAALMVPCIAVQAQQTAALNVTTISATTQPVAGATVTLSNTAGKAAANGATNAQGVLNLTALTPGTYILRATAVGYKPVVKSNIIVVAGISNQTLVMQPASTQLTDVAITAERPAIKRDAEKTTINVAADPTNAGNNALDVLRKLPGVMVDQNDNVSLMGKSSVLITIDGKPTYFSATQLATMLKSMQASQLNTIEIVTNPNAKYDANSTGGVINIKTKKLVTEGINGILTAGVAYNIHPTEGLTPTGAWLDKAEYNRDDRD